MCQELQIFAFVCMYEFLCKLSLFRLCASYFGITTVDDITIRITCVAFCFHIAQISFGSSWFFFVCRLLFWRGYVYSGQLCLSKRCSSSSSSSSSPHPHESYVGSVRRHWFVRNYAAVPVQLEIVILQYIGWCVLIVWTSVFNQFSCFRQFLKDSFCYSYMFLYILGMC